jgi:hypothetical protein
MSVQEEGVVAPDQTQVLDSVNNDLDRIELWTAALSSFQRPPPAYLPNTVRADERMILPRDTALPLGEVVRSAFRDHPYIAVTIALGLGWVLGRTHRSW